MDIQVYSVACFGHIIMHLPANGSLVTSYVYGTVPDSHNHHPLLLYFVSTRVTI